MDSWIDLYNVFAGFIERFYTDFFFWVLNTSISASFLVAAIIILRLILKKAPKAMIVALWGMVAIRLICPFSLESALSLIPSEETIPTEQFQYQETRHDDYELQIVSNPIYPEVVDYKMPGTVENNSIKSMYAYFCWLGGMGVMLIYSAISYIVIKRKVRVSAPYKENIYICDGIKTPFILGVFKPKIYLPSDIPDKEKEYVIAHEKAHLKRRDHWWKPLGFVLLSLHWFNPLMWVAYVFLCRDIEFACDEKVIKSLGEEGKKPYSEALLNCSVPRKMITACPVAFGETGVKDRIKSVLNYKKPAFWVVIAALVVSVVLAVCFLTNPVGDKLTEVESIHFPSVSNATVVTPSGIFETSDYDETKRAVEFAKSVRVFGNPVSEDRSNDRESAYKVSFTVSGINAEIDRFFTINFNADCTVAWVDNFVKPSLSYKVKKPEKVLEFFDSHEIYCATFVAGELLCSNGMHSVVGGVENNYFYNFDSRMLLSEKTSGVLGWNTVGEMTEIELDKYNFDYIISEGVEYNGFDPAKIRMDNKKAWSVINKNSDVDGYSYMLLEQKNGEFILVKAFGAHDTRWAYKLEKAWSEAPLSLEAAVSEAVLANENAVYFDTWYGFESHYIVDKIIQPDGDNTLINAFVLTLYEVYYIEDDGTLICENTSAKPVMMTFNVGSDGAHLLVDYQEYNVKLNAQESKKIEQMFPKAVNGDYSREMVFMQDDCYEKAAAYFNIRDYSVRYDVQELMPFLSLPYNDTRNELFAQALNSDKLSVNSQQYLPIYKFDSLEELTDFRDKYADKIDFNVDWDECPSFNEYVSKFNEEYFSKNSLLLIIAEEPSVSFRHKVGGVVVNGYHLQVTVNTITVSPFAELMGCWFVPVQLEKNVTDSCVSFDAVKGVDVEKSVVAKYSYTEAGETVNPYIVLYNNNTFDFVDTPYSSQVNYGGYEYRGGYLVLTTLHSKPKEYYFLLEGDTLIFDAEKSTPLIEYKLDGADKPARPAVPDGAVFN